MKKLKLLSLMLPFLLLTLTVHASVIYHFEFTELEDVTDGTGEDFSITLSYPDFVTTTGMVPQSTSQSTTLGYSVAFAGTNTYGWWGFDDEGDAHFSGEVFWFSGDSFLFSPVDLTIDDYITSIGVYPGYLNGNAPTAFTGKALLTVTGTPVPEPSTFLLLGCGLAGLAFLLRQKKKQHKQL